MPRILATRCPTCGGDRAVYHRVQRSLQDMDWLLDDWLLVCPACQPGLPEVAAAVQAEEAESGMIYCRRESKA